MAEAHARVSRTHEAATGNMLRESSVGGVGIHGGHRGRLNHAPLTWILCPCGRPPPRRPLTRTKGRARRVGNVRVPIRIRPQKKTTT
jgi:hypothetical protein